MFCNGLRLRWTNTKRRLSNDGADYDGDGDCDLGDNDDDNDNTAILVTDTGTVDGEDCDAGLDNVDVCAQGETGWVTGDDTDHDGDGCQDSGEDTDDDDDNRADSVDACDPIVYRARSNWDQQIVQGDFDGDGCKDDHV